MHYSGENTYLLLMVQKFINSKLNLNVVSKGFSADNMRKTGFYGPVYDFSVDHYSINKMLKGNIFYSNDVFYTSKYFRLSVQIL